MSVNKVTWQQVGHVTAPGRYMFRFGWLTIAADDLAIWTRFPDASFTLVQTLSPPLAADTDMDEAPTVEMEEYHLGAFDLNVNDEPHAGGESGERVMSPVDQTLVEAAQSPA